MRLFVAYSLKIKSLFTSVRKLPQAIYSPSERYRQAKLLHSIRVALAVLTSIVLTTGINIPHGVWASVSLLVVIGGLQHHGNIRKKSAERAVGTMLGALLGLMWVIQYAVIGSLPLTYALLSISAGICAYYAIDKGGYIALLTAITMCIVAGHGDNSIEIGLWRTANVLIGIAIALLFSFALPLYAVYSWRYQLAKNLRSIASIIKHLTSNLPFTPEEQIVYFSTLSQRSVSLRNLMSAVSKETDIPIQSLEEIQRQHRATLSAVEILASALSSKDSTYWQSELQPAFQAKANGVRKIAIEIARGLRSGKIQRITCEPTGGSAEENPSSLNPSMESQGVSWVVQQIFDHLEKLKELLEDLEKKNLLINRQRPRTR
jgi:uncharacterized membrane protein YccC